MTRFADLGEDLANIVCEFAFTCRYNAVFYSLKHYLHYVLSCTGTAHQTPDL